MPGCSKPPTTAGPSSLPRLGDLVGTDFGLGLGVTRPDRERGPVARVQLTGAFMRLVSPDSWWKTPRVPLNAGPDIAPPWLRVPCDVGRLSCWAALRAAGRGAHCDVAPAPRRGPLCGRHSPELFNTAGVFIPLLSLCGLASWWPRSSCVQLNAGRRLGGEHRMDAEGLSRLGRLIRTAPALGFGRCWLRCGACHAASAAQWLAFTWALRHRPAEMFIPLASPGGSAAGGRGRTAFSGTLSAG